MAEAEAPVGRPAPHRVPRRVVSGMRPTGRMHLGHYQGALKSWIELTKIAECFFFSADWHALTTDYKDPSGIREAQREMFTDWIAAGLDPERCTFFVQSQVTAHAEAAWLLADRTGSETASLSTRPTKTGTFSTTARLTREFWSRLS